MKKFIAPFFLLLGFHAVAQVNCPTFSRYGGFDRIEVSPLWATVETHDLAEKIENSAILVGGAYENKSIAPGIIFRYYVQERIAIRLKMIYMQRLITDTRETVDSALGTHIIYDEEFDQVVYKIAPGFQWTFYDEHISFFGGLEVPYTAYGDWTQSEYLLDESLTDTTGTETFTTRVVPGGYSVGLGAMGGFQYYFTRSFALGFELALAYEYTSVGGDITSSSVTLGSVSSTGGSVYNETMKYMRFTPVRPALFLTLRF